MRTRDKVLVTLHMVNVLGILGVAVYVERYDERFGYIFSYWDHVGINYSLCIWKGVGMDILDRFLVVLQVDITLDIV